MVDISKRPATPWHLWAIGAASVLWNGVGVWQWYQKVTGAQAYWSALTMEQVFYLRSAPLWTDVAYGVAVWCGLLGALMLLLRRKLAFNAFVAGLIAMLAHTVYVLALSNGREVIGAGGTAFTLVVALIFALQIAYSHWARRRGLIR
ncbi:hypothetical protein ABE453_13580 [Brevundimonas diminuta]|uniref:hypothetical protein n=1 Tax=Brevundimonas diminuta TaxID=293 RepID=UPI0032081A05